jgi:hypothetical protein
MPVKIRGTIGKARDLYSTAKNCFGEELIQSAHEIMAELVCWECTVRNPRFGDFGGFSVYTGM